MSGAGGALFVLSSPSGGGKTTVTKQVLRKVRGLSRSVSVTTRKPRSGERKGRDYRFVTEEEFHRLQKEGAFVESANVHGSWYGTPRAALEARLEKGRSVLLCIDVQGARKIRRVFGRKAVLIFLVPPSVTDLRKRLKQRSTESPAAIRARLAAAKKELACASWYDYRVPNARVEDAVAQLRTIIRAHTTSARARATGGKQ